VRLKWILLLLLLCLGNAGADGKVFRMRDWTPEQIAAHKASVRLSQLTSNTEGPEEYLNPDQRAALIVRGKEQRLIVQSRFPGPLEDFCWVVPVAGRPQVEAAEGRVFEGLLALTQMLCYPEPSLLKYDGLQGLIDRGSVPSGDVKVLERKIVGTYDVAILEASKADSLIDWLNENGFQFPGESQEAVEHYVDKGWYWVALRIDPAQASEQVAADLAQGILAPVSLSYEADSVSYPMKLTATDPGQTRVVLYVIAGVNAAVEGFSYQYAGPIGKLDKRLGDSLNGLIRKGDLLSVVYGTVEHEGLVDDLEVLPVQLDVPAAPMARPRVGVDKRDRMILIGVCGALLFFTVCAVAMRKLRTFGLLGMILTVAVALVVPNFFRARERGRLTACKSNLKHIGTGLEMYSTDWSGHYPSSSGKLTPNYLKTIPSCPGENGGDYLVKTWGEPWDGYFIYCLGNHSQAAIPPALVSSSQEYGSLLLAWQEKVWHGRPCPTDATLGNW
jgi:hypothetical protein